MWGLVGVSTHYFPGGGTEREGRFKSVSWGSRVSLPDDYILLPKLRTGLSNVIWLLLGYWHTKTLFLD